MKRIQLEVGDLIEYKHYYRDSVLCRQVTIRGVVDGTPKDSWVCKGAVSCNGRILLFKEIVRRVKRRFVSKKIMRLIHSGIEVK